MYVVLVPGPSDVEPLVSVASILAKERQQTQKGIALEGSGQTFQLS